MATQGQDIQTVETEHLLQVYRRVPIVLTHGAGSYVYDVDGHAYLDFLSGLGVASLGHAHPGLATALGEQARALLHTSNLYFHPLQGQVGRRLTALSGLPRSFFCNSGTEAVEGCLKFARRYWHTRGETARTGSSPWSGRFTAAPSDRCRSPGNLAIAPRLSRSSRRSPSCHRPTPTPSIRR